MKILWFLPVVLLCALGVGIFYYKVSVLGVPLKRNALSEVWSIRMRATVHGDDKRVRVSLQLPEPQKGFRVLAENFTSGEFGLATVVQEGVKRAEWSAKASSGPHTLEYELRVALAPESVKPKRATITPDATVEIPDGLVMSLLRSQPLGVDARKVAPNEDKVSAFVCGLLTEQSDTAHRLFEGSDKPRERLARIATLLTHLGVESALATGALLRDKSRDVISREWLLVRFPEKDLLLNPDRCHWVDDTVARRFFIWSMGVSPLVQAKGGSSSSSSITGGPLAELSGVRRAARTKFSRAVLGLSIYSLPIDAQGMYRGLLLLPIGALVIVILRSLIGIESFGTFMPVLVALAFRETGLWKGLAFFVGILTISLFARKYFEYLQLLIVPRLVAMLHVVLILLVTFGLGSHLYSGGKQVVVALLPVVVVTMAIERTALLLEETGYRKSFWVVFQSLCMAVICYLVISNSQVEYLIFMFPELLLVGLFVAVLLGRYSGYRVLEIYRFRSFVDEV